MRNPAFWCPHTEAPAVSMEWRSGRQPEEKITIKESKVKKNVPSSLLASTSTRQVYHIREVGRILHATTLPIYFSHWSGRSNHRADPVPQFSQIPGIPSLIGSVGEWVVKGRYISESDVRCEFKLVYNGLLVTQSGPKAMGIYTFVRFYVISNINSKSQSFWQTSSILYILMLDILSFAYLFPWFYILLIITSKE